MKSSALHVTGRHGLAKAELRGEILVKQPTWLTEVVAATVHAVRGQVKAIACAIGVPDHAVYEVADINNPKPLKASWIPAIVCETGSFAILDALEQQVGRIAYRLPNAIETAHDELHAGLARTLNDISVFVASHGESLKDGRLDREELARLSAQIRVAVAGLLEYEQLAIARVERDTAVRR